MIRPRWYIIGFRSQFIFYWDLFVIAFAIYNAIAVPLQISFYEVRQLYQESLVMWILEVLVDMIFLCDIIINFLKSYLVVNSGDEIFAPRLIAIHYLKGGFFVDFFSTLPMVLAPIAKAIENTPGNERFGQLLGSVNQGLRFFKLVRLRKLQTAVS